MTDTSTDKQRRTTRFKLVLPGEATHSPRHDTIDTQQSLGTREQSPPSAPAIQGKHLRKVESGRVAKFQSDGLKPFHLVQGSASKVQPRLLKYKSPWDTFEWALEYTERDDRVTVVQNKLNNDLVFALREFPVREFDRLEQRFNKLKHGNIVTAKGFFLLGSSCFVLSDIPDVSVSLMRVIACPAFPTERQLAGIIGQILRAIMFLISKGICLKELNYSRIYLDGNGRLQIVCFTDTEIWHEDRPPTAVIHSLGTLMVELMQKVPNPGGNFGVRNLKRWPLDSRASGFLLKLSSAGSLFQLTSDEFVSPKCWSAVDLKSLVRKTMETTLPPCKLYQGEELD